MSTRQAITCLCAIWIAGVTLAFGQTNTNLIVNGDFEKGAKGYPSEWAFKDLSESEYNEKYSYEMKGGKVGERCMLIKGGGYFQQNIQTPVSKRDKYRISAYLKTENMSGKIYLDVIPGKGWIKYWADLPVEKPTQDWTLVEKTFNPTEDDHGFGVIIRTGIDAGKAWIDGVRLELVEKGKVETNAPDLAARKEESGKISASIAEQPKIKITSFYPLGERGLFWEKESLQFSLNLTNTTAEQQVFDVSFVIKDFFGAQIRESKTNFTVSAKADLSQNIDLGMIPDKYGFFCVRASVKQKDAIIDQKATGCCILQPANVETDNFFSANPNAAFDRHLVKAMQRIGVSSKGLNFRLSWVPETQRTNFDAYISNELTNGQYTVYWNSDLQLIGQICEDGGRGFRSFEPKWYAAEMEARYKRGEFPDPDEYYKELGDFVEALARQAHKRIKLWHVAEEIDGTFAVCPDKQTTDWAVERYIRRAKVINERLKKVDPDCTVIAFGASCSELRAPYWSQAREKLLPALKGHFDMFGPDAYCDVNWFFTKDNIDQAGSEKQNFREMLLATVALQKSVGTKTSQIVICEKGWGVAYHSEPDDEVARRVAYLVARYYITAKSVTNVLYVSNLGYSAGAAHAVHVLKKISDDANPMCEEGFWHTDYAGQWCFYPRSWAAVHATLNRLLVNVTDPMELNIRTGFYAYAFQKKEQAVTAFWTIEKQPYQMALNLPVKTEYCDLMGNKKPLPEGKAELTVSECPFFLITQGSVNEISNMVSKADFPSKSLFNAEVHVSDLSTLTVYLQNKVTQPIEARIKLDPLSSAKLPVATKEVVIPGGGRIAADFEMEATDLAKLNGEKITGKVLAQGREIPISENIELIPVQEIKKPVTVDGDLSKYSQLKPILLGEKNLVTLPGYAANSRDLWRNADNLSAKFYLAWDTNNFYMAAEVTDDVLVQKQTGENIWKDDCVQFAFDTKNDAMKTDATENAGYNENDYNLGMALTKAGQVCWCWVEAGKGTKKFEGVRKFPLVIKREGTRTIYELAIPWKNLAPLEPKPGKVFRFSFVVFDNDNENQAEAKYWLGLTHGIAGGVDPSAYKTFVLAQ